MEIETLDKHILVAESEEIMREFTMDSLKCVGFKNVYGIGNGLHALQELSKKHYDLLITATTIPGLKGYEIIRGYKANPNHNGTRFIGMGAGIDQETRDTYARLDVPFIQKPFRQKELLYLVNQVLNQ